MVGVTRGTGLRVEKTKKKAKRGLWGIQSANMPNPVKCHETPIVQKIEYYPPFPAYLPFPILYNAIGESVA